MKFSHDRRRCRRISSRWRSAISMPRAAAPTACRSGSARRRTRRISAQLALESAQQILKFYDSYYAIKYPFGKLDVARGSRFRRRRDGKHRRDLLSRDRSARRQRRAHRSRTRKTHRLGPRPRDGASVVRRSRHDAVVGRHLAERRFRDLDGEQAARRGAPGMERRRRRSAREPDGARPRFAEGDASHSRRRSKRRPRSTRRSTRSRIRKAPRCCA